jgi:hypothetical protein
MQVGNIDMPLNSKNTMLSSPNELLYLGCSYQVND